jgi:hypothetical protein
LRRYYCQRSAVSRRNHSGLLASLRSFVLVVACPLIIIRGWKTAAVPTSRAANFQRPRSLGSRICGIQTLGQFGTQVCDLCSLLTAATVKPGNPKGGYYASVAFQFQPARSDFSANDNCSSSFTSSTFHLPSTFSSKHSARVDQRDDRLVRLARSPPGDRS